MSATAPPSGNDLGGDTPETFFATCSQFKLGSLVTEAPNPITANLAETCQADLATGLQMLQLADVHALQRLVSDAALMPKVRRLAQDIHAVLEAGHSVFFEGCGATGRLSLTIEVLCREGLVEDRYRDQIKGFMAGGDAALIRSIEQFEDRRDFGARQLTDMGFVDGDLCVAITEGGETTFVIAAVEEAVRVGPSRAHWFLYCNPDDVLAAAAERSANVLANAAIHKMNLCVGPMGITGSTRMQATTVQLLVAGLCTQHHARPERVEPALRDFAAAQGAVDYGALAAVTAAEAALYARGVPFTYRTDYFTCTVLTDTTERAPTFSLPPFESFANPADAPSPVYLHVPGTATAAAAWMRLLRREPRGLAWDAVWRRTGNAAIHGYDFSDQVVAKRRHLLTPELSARSDGGAKLIARFHLDAPGARIEFQVPSVSGAPTGVEYVGAEIAVPASWVAAPAAPSALVAALGAQQCAEPLLLNVLAKVLLNAHSTALMGVNGRLRSNVMTYVRPSNRKLIDRAARYVIQLFGEAQQNLPPAEREAPLSYEDVVTEIFRQRAFLGPSDPIVVRVLDSMIEQRRNAAAAAVASS